MDILQVVVFAISIFLFVYLLIMQPHKIKGESMQPNFPDGEYLLTDKVTYRFKEPKRGDVVVFKAPGTDGEEFIKRIIALPGDIVSVRGGKVYISDQLLDESGYLANTVITQSGSFLTDGEEVIVPAEHYFVLGDNRPHSSDSRTWGFVPKEKLNGRAWFVYWPPKSVGVIEETLYPN